MDDDDDRKVTRIRVFSEDFHRRYFNRVELLKAYKYAWCPFIFIFVYKNIFHILGWRPAVPSMTFKLLLSIDDCSMTWFLCTIYSKCPLNGDSNFSRISDLLIPTTYAYPEASGRCQLARWGVFNFSFLRPSKSSFYTVFCNVKSFPAIAAQGNFSDLSTLSFSFPMINWSCASMRFGF